MSDRLQPGAPLALEVRRLLAAEIAEARRCLDLARTEPARGVHEVRKRFKRIRALLSLVRSADRDFFVIEDSRYRDLGRTLAPAREAAALVETVDRFSSDEDDREGGLRDLRTALASRGPRDGDARLAVAIDNAVAWCEAGAAAAARFETADADDVGASILAEGVRATTRQAARALKRVRRHAAVEDFHDLRKAVKAHAAQCGLLADLWPRAGAARRKAADRLGDELGQLNDIHVMRHVIMSNPAQPGGKAATSRLLKRLDRKRKALSRDAVAAARSLFDERPSALAADVARSVMAAHGDAVEPRAAAAG